MRTLDPAGAHVRRHVEELREVPLEHLAEPWARRVKQPLHGLSRNPAENQGTRARADSHPMSIEVTNGLPEGADQGVSLELTLAEAEAVKSWLLKPSADGSAAIDDENAKSVMVKLGAKLDYIQGVQRVRDELEQAGFATAQMSDDEVADLGRRISESPIRRYSGH